MPVERILDRFFLRNIGVHFDGLSESVQTAGEVRKAVEDMADVMDPVKSVQTTW